MSNAPPLPWGMRNDHGGPLNAKVHRIFCGLWKGDPAAALLELLESDEPIDVHARKAIARAVSNDIAGDESALRLRVVQPRGSSATWESQIEGVSNDQLIKERFDALTAEGLPQGRAFQRIIDAGLANSDRAIQYALERAGKRPFKVTRRRK